MIIRNIGKKIEEFNEIDMVSSMEEDVELLKSLLDNTEDEDQRKELALKYKLFEAGRFGEEKVLYELKNADIPMYCLKNVRLNYDDKMAQIDFFIITNSFMCALEVKSLTGDIKVHNDGRFERFIKTKNGKLVKREAMYSPIEQNERHVRLIEKLLKDKEIIKYCPIYHLVVLSNAQGNLDMKYAQKEMKDVVVRVDQLRKKLIELDKRETSINLMVEVMDNAIEAITENDKYANEQYVNPMIEKYSAINEVKVDKDQLRHALKIYRTTKAQELGLKQYAVFYNEHLEDLIEKMPKSSAELATVKGFGDVRISKYGEDIIRIIENC